MAKPIEGFLTKYQSDEVLIPFIDDLEQLLMHIWSNSLLKRMITEESPQLKSKLLIQKSTRCTRTLILVLLHMSGCKGSEKDKMDFAMEAKKALVFFVDRINAKSPLLYSLTRNLKCLQPSYIIKSSEDAVDKFRKCCHSVADANLVTLQDCDNAIQQFRDFTQGEQNPLRLFS